jgi:hypothetical protein
VVQGSLMGGGGLSSDVRPVHAVYVAHSPTIAFSKRSTGTLQEEGSRFPNLIDLPKATRAP